MTSKNGMEEEYRMCLPCYHNIIESEYSVIIICPVYNELCGELFNYATQLENNFNNLNDDDKFVFLFSATYICFSATDICFYTARTCFNIPTVRRGMLYNTR